MLLPSAQRIRKPPNVPPGVRDVLLWKFSADEGGGLWKLLVNRVNDQYPQSLRQLKPICEFTANKSCNNITVAVFYGSCGEGGGGGVAVEGSVWWALAVILVKRVDVCERL